MKERCFPNRIAANAIILFSAVAVAAEPIVPSPKLPTTAPWDLKQLSEPPSFEWLANQGSARSLVYQGEPFAGKPTHVFAYYATPGTLTGDSSKDKNLPAVVLIHGGGGTAFREWAELWAKRGYAAIAMDLAGHRPDEGKNPHQRENRTRLADGGPDQGDLEKFGRIAEAVTEQWPYHAVAAVICAHSLIRSFDEVDDNRTAVTGISWGGYLTCIVAGVDTRFRAAVPVYGCGFLHENSAWLDRLAKMTPPLRKRWVTLWDPSQYLPAVSMPILFVNGTNDFAYPLDSYMKSFDAVQGLKQIRITVNMPHGHTAGWTPQEIGLFIDHHLLGKRGLPSIGKPENQDHQIRWSCESPVKLVEAALHMTKDGGPVNKRQWTTLAARLDGETVVADAPPVEATAWFVTVSDERGAVVSSRVTLPATGANDVFAPRQETLPVAPPDGAIVLFDDKGHNLFLGKHGGASNWPIEDGALVSTSGDVRSNHIVSQLHFRDADIHVEFMVDEKAGGNSGIYIHGHYELQIFNSFGKDKPTMEDMGAVYGFAPPLVNAARAPGQWQVYDIRYRAPRRDAAGTIVLDGIITAWLNGQKVQDQTKVGEPRSEYHPFRYKSTPYLQQVARQQQKTMTGPVFLQDHDSPARFRNVWVRPLDENAFLYNAGR